MGWWWCGWWGVWGRGGGWGARDGDGEGCSEWGCKLSVRGGDREMQRDCLVMGF